MHPKKPVSAHIQEAENANLKQIIAKTQHLQHLDTIVKQLLVAPLNQHCWVANYRDGCLIIGVENANWAFYLRFQQQELIKKCRDYSEFAELITIEFYIKPQDPDKPEPLVKPPFELTKKSTKLLAETAATTEDARLKEILTRLANSIEEKI